IDEEKLGVTSDAFSDALAVEGVFTRREYLPVPIFEYEMLKHRRTYGDSGFPFTAFPWKPPDPDDFPGFQAFKSNLLFFTWSHRAQSQHVAAIATAVRKVANLLPPPSHPVRTRTIEAAVPVSSRLMG